MTGRTGAVTGTLADFTTELSATNTLVVSLDADLADPEALVGQYVYVENDGVRNAVYLIEGAELHGDRTLALDIGGATTIRGYLSRDDPNAGFRHDVEQGAAVRIPLTREWGQL